MKTTLILTLGLMLSSCLSNKKVGEQYRESTAIWQQNEAHTRYGLYRQQEDHWDSSTIHWQYVTAQPFYYHPDSGLYGWGGQLQMLSRSVEAYTRSDDSLLAVLSHYDSSRMLQDVDHQYENVKKRPINVDVYIIALVVGIIVIVWYRLQAKA